MYPCPPEAVGLNQIRFFRERYKRPVGLSDHSGRIHAGLAAAALGIAVLETHVTLSREMPGPDVSSSLTPAELTARRADEQRAAADFMGVRHVVMLGYPDGALEDTREFLGDVVRAIRRHRPDTVFVHDPYRMKSFQHRDHRKAGIVTTDAIYPFARDHLHFPEHVEEEGLEPHKVRELWYWGVDQPDVIVDVTDSIDRQIAALVRHESQVPGFNVPDGDTLGARVKRQAAEHAAGYGFTYGAVFRRLVARR